ncbi:MAG: hypothetical protein ONB11_12750 [candidate division KSB1 bacterium]|nr:hypothetical protein [candidate division KSB1 bacterium]
MAKTIREIKEQYIVDASGKRIGVVLDAQVYQELVAELQSLRASQPKSRTKNGKRRATTRARKTTAARVVKSELSENERAVQILQDAGILVELDPALKRQAAEWRALPEERKRAVIEKLNSLRLEPSLSQIIHDERR